ncbi:ABC transporter ATP-binding protein [Nocardioides sp. ChNu-153]|uniref:ABC transporter transmembrane domain-containing protein n=1 Tax=Nocardioides sp. ChNu-153 TaxID=2779364 RepID=UPI00264A7D0B|nr:ABC transporter ATP-binding protein [Nocardioides sp. ChNu-153]MDN7121133.1 ABC transporter ATP-binding protein [Nocardioides sp. ChNu-153]
MSPTTRPTAPSTVPPPRLPALLVGRRRGLVGLLVATATTQAALTVAVALLVGALVSAPPGGTTPVAAGLVVVLAAAGGTAYGARVLAERLGQDYVHELRGRLVGAALRGAGARSLGITIARTTNDLTAVRGWVAEGIAPLVAAVPLVAGSLGLLAALHPRLALAAGVPLVLLVSALLAVTPHAYERAAALRRQRGRLAGRVTDSLRARDGIVAAGGEERELRRVARDSRRVGTAAVARARTAGLLQAACLVAGGATAALVVAVARADDLPAGVLATALTVTGALAAPLAGVGRVAELRQNFRAARRVVAPHLGEPPGPGGPSAPATRSSALRVTSDAERVFVPGLLDARPGDRVRVVGPDAATTTATLLGLVAPEPGHEVVVDGWDCGRVAPAVRRRLVGLAAHDVPLERGTLARAVRYRRPDADDDAVTAALTAAGLDPVLARLPRGARTELRRGGHPLTPAEVARVKVARAALGAPVLLVLDRIDAALDAEGRRHLRALVAAHPGVVVFVSDTPEEVAPGYRTVELDAEGGSVRAGTARVAGAAP